MINAGMVHILLSVTILLTGTVMAQQSEYQVKAVFLFNFTQFVEWPAGSFTSNETPMVIGILGKDPFGKYLAEAVTGEKLGTHPIVVERYDNINEVKNCHILFINSKNEKYINEIIATVKNKNILTVNDSDDFLKHGGIVRFFKRNNKVKLEISPSAAKKAGLNISSKLLAVAAIYEP